jgi:hypothetical protein
MPGGIVIIYAIQVPVVGRDEQMPLPIGGGLVELLSGFRERRDDGSRYGVELLDCGAAIKDVVSERIEGETVSRNPGQQRMQRRRGPTESDRPKVP